jgi:hypothetical protein
VSEAPVEQPQLQNSEWQSPGLLDQGCMGLIADAVMILASTVTIGLGALEHVGWTIGLVAGALLYALMLRRWFYKPARRADGLGAGERRGGETFERDFEPPDGD